LYCNVLKLTSQVKIWIQKILRNTRNIRNIRKLTLYILIITSQRNTTHQILCFLQIDNDMSLCISHIDLRFNDGIRHISFNLLFYCRYVDSFGDSFFYVQWGLGYLQLLSSKILVYNGRRNNKLNFFDVTIVVNNNLIEFEIINPLFLGDI